MIRAGIIDPTKVVRHALQDAASVAGLLITTKGEVAEKPELKPASPAMPPAAAWNSKTALSTLNRDSHPSAGNRWRAVFLLCLSGQGFSSVGPGARRA
jgi:hypothetical protein